MKKYIGYLIILALGLFLGWLLFGQNNSHKNEASHLEQHKTNSTWTCAMHPQIKQAKFGKCPICGMDLVLQDEISNGLKPNQFKMTKNAIALANIQTTKVERFNSNGSTYKLSGKIVENESLNAVQISYFSGRIEQLNVNYTGQTIKKGQLLATIYSPELYAAQQELITALSLKDSQPLLYKAVRNKLKLWKLSDNQISKIENSKKVISNVPIYATVSGTVTQKLVNKGDAIKKGEALLKTTNLNSVWGNIDIYENQIDLLKLGQKINIKTNAYPNKTFIGKVDFISPVLNTQTRTATVRVSLDNKKQLLKPGLFITANITKSDNNSIISIPTSAVLWTGKRSVVYVKTENTTFELREVILGKRMEDYYQILDGLSINDEIVTNGTFTVDASAQLQGKKSMMNTESIKASSNNVSTKSIDNKVQSSKKLKDELNNVLEAYLNVKNALVNDDYSKTKKLSKTLFNNLVNADKKLKSDDNFKKWYNLSNKLKISSSNMVKQDDLEKQRDHFKELSQQFIQLVKEFNTSHKIYIDFCPMGNNNNGTYWLSKTETIRNPYYGKAMLTCGKIQQTLN